MGTLKGKLMNRFLVFVACCCVCLAQVGSIPLTSTAWTTFNVGPVPLSNDASGDLTFYFPEVEPFVPGTDQGSINYLFTGEKGSLAGGTCNYQGQIVQGYCLTLQFQIVTTGAPIFNWELEPSNNCMSNCTPASVRLYFERKADKFLNKDFYRWWSVAYTPLAQGVYTMMVPLVYDQWTSLNGTTDPVAFQAALKAVANAGVTFGGGYFAGHGDNVSGGTAQMVITSFAVTQ